MSQLFPEDALSALEDSRPEAGARDAGSRLLVRCLGLSLVLHLVTAAVALGLGQMYVDGAQNAGSGPAVITVSLTPGVEDDDPGGWGPASAEAAPEPSSPQAEADQAPADNPLLDAAIIARQEEPDQPPELKKMDMAPPELSVPLVKPPEKNPPAPPKTTAAKSRKSPAPADAPPKPQAGAAAKSGGGPAESAGAGADPGSGQGRAAGPGRGGGGGDAAGYVKGNYEYIKKRIRQHLVYSPQAKRMGIQGTVTVSFTIGSDGRARNISVAKTSGHGSLDESAIRAVQNASPFPPPPAPARITVPVSFSLK